MGFGVYNHGRTTCIGTGALGRSILSMAYKTPEYYS